MALSARSTIGHKWRVIDVQSDKVAASGALKDQSALALPIQPFTADFSSLSTVGAFIDLYLSCRMTALVRFAALICVRSGPPRDPRNPYLLLSYFHLPGTYQFRVDGCDEAPLFTIQNPLYERAERSEPRALRASSNTTKGYTDGGVARGVGIALVVITVLLFVVVLALCGWVIVLYCC